MKYYSIFLLVTFLCMISLTTSFFPLIKSNTQVPAKEFGITPICSNTEIQPIEKENNEKEFTIYGNVSLGYTIEYPNDWKRIETHCILEGAGLIQTSSTINFISTPNSSKNGLLGITVADYYSTKLSIDEFVKVYSKDFSNMIESSKIIMLDGKPAAKFIINTGSDITKLTQITILPNDKRYDINYPISSLLSNSTIQHMIQSFKILDKAASNSKDVSEETELG